MPDPNWMRRIGATPAKLATVVVLAAVLAGLIVLQSGAYTESAATPQTEAGREHAPKLPLRTAKRAAVATPATRLRKPDAPTWSTIALEEILAHDPFAVPAALVPKVPSEDDPAREADEKAEDRQRQREQAIAAVRQQGVEMVLLAGSEPVAVVGGRLVRVGDELEGFRVVSISSSGLTLSVPDEQP